MMRRYSIVLVVLLLAVGLVSCGKQSKNEPDQITPSGTIGVTDAATPTPLVEEPTPTPVVDDPTPHIVWAINMGAWIPEEARDVIQQFIDEQGIECRIDFIDPNIVEGVEYEQWIAEQCKAGIVPDIVSSSFWEYGSIDAAHFVKNNFYPLNDYLHSADGNALFANYSKGEWAKSSVDGVNYFMPKRLRNDDRGVFLYINEKYMDYFGNEFDGTYQSIRDIYDAIGDKKLLIFMDESSSSELGALLGGYVNSFMIASYQTKDSVIVDLTKREETKAFYQMFFTDLQDGILHEEKSPEDLSDNVLVYVHCGKIDSPKGFTEYTVYEDPMVTTVGTGYGIWNDAKHKDLALQVISACYSNPEIVSLLSWRAADAERWISRTEYLNTVSETVLTGFIPDLTESQHKALKEYSEDISFLYQNRYTEKAGQVILNPDYPEILEKFFSEPKDYGNLFEVLNQQLAAWIQTRTEQ